MTDAEIICEFMEPRPSGYASGKGMKWWYPSAGYVSTAPFPVAPIELDLDALWLVEDKLSDEQWQEYASLMMDPSGERHTRFLIHATPAQKISALARVLRGGQDGK